MDRQAAGERLPRAAKRKKMAIETNVVDNTTLARLVPAAVAAAPNTEPPDILSKVAVATKVRRQVWTSVAIASFFEGLAEHGKSFERILAFMHNKHKKKQSDPFISNLGRNQVRFFYYRTWHKVSTLLANAQKELESPSQNKRNNSQIKKGSKVCPTQSEDEETEGELIEGDVPFDISLDEGEEIFDKVTLSTIDEESTQQSCSLDAPGPLLSLDNPSSVEAEQDYESIEAKDAPPTATPLEDNKTDHPSIEQDNMAAIDTDRAVKTDSKKKETGEMIQVNGGWHSLDLVAMICYSKLKQKYRGDSVSFAKRLHELVYRGSTTIRIKGKRKIHRLKIPGCPALRNCKTQSSVGNTDSIIVDYPDSIDLTKINVTVELIPLDSDTWECIQQHSINPRLRLTTPLSRTLGELFEFLAKKWHLPSKDIFQTLKLYRWEESGLLSSDLHESLPLNSLMTIRDLQLMVHQQSLPPQTKISLQYTIHQSECSSVNDPSHLLALLYFFQSIEQPSTAGQQQCHLSPVIKSSFDITPSLATNDQHTSNRADPSPLTTPTTTAGNPPANLDTTPTSWVSPPLVEKRATHSSSAAAVLSSPTVREYWESLSKKSPIRSIIKSPLNKYRKLHLHRVSPLKGSLTSPNLRGACSHIRRPVKRTRLDFTNTPSVPVSLSSLPLSSSQKQTLSNSLLTTATANISSSKLITDSAQQSYRPPPSTSLQPVVTSSVCVSSSQAVIDLTTVSRNTTSDSFSLAKLKSGKLKSQGQRKLQHLVTVPKKTFSNSSFSSLRLSDLLQSVQDNLKDTESLETAAHSSADHVTNISSSSAVSHSTQMTTAIPKGTSVILSDIAPPSTLKNAITATAKTLKESPSQLARQHQQQSSSYPAAPTVRSTGPLARVDASSSDDPSPLQLLASQVASSNTSKTSKTHDISVKMLSLSPISPIPAPTISPVPAHSNKRQTRRRSQANSQSRQTNTRPVIPKPLQYLPQMAALTVTTPSISSVNLPQVQQQFLPTTSRLQTTTSSAVHSLPSVSSLSSESRDVLKASPVIPSLVHSKSPVLSQLPIGSVPLMKPVAAVQETAQQPSQAAALNPQILQQQLTNLLLTLLQQQQQQLKPPLTTDIQPLLAAPPTAVANTQAQKPISQSIQLTQQKTTAITNTTTAPLVTAGGGAVTDSLHTSDTVSELLRGLTDEQASLQKLSEETVDKLPTFARVMMEMSSASASNIEPATAPPPVQCSEELASTAVDDGGQVASGSSENSLLQFIQGIDSTELGPGLSDPNLRHIVENSDFSDMFSQLRDILKTPDKRQQTSSSSSHEESAAGSKSISPPQAATEPLHDNTTGILDAFNSPFKIKTSNIDNQSNTAVVRSLLEENSVDYINKFKELASAMSKTSQS